MTMKVTSKKFVTQFLFPISLVLFCISQCAVAKDLNLICSFKSFCEERVPNACLTPSANNFETEQHVKLSDKTVEYWDDIYEIIKINDSVVLARHIKKYPKLDSFNESLLNLNRYTGVMNLTHTLYIDSREFKNKVTQINRVQYLCVKSVPKF